MSKKTKPSRDETVQTKAEHLQLTLHTPAVSIAHEVDRHVFGNQTIRFIKEVIDRPGDAVGNDLQLPLPHVEPPSEAPRRRKAWDRDHTWHRWCNAEKLSHAQIRDRWNGMTDEERRSIAPKWWRPIEEGSAGNDVVKKALKKARGESNA